CMTGKVKRSPLFEGRKRLSKLINMIEQTMNDECIWAGFGGHGYGQFMAREIMTETRLAQWPF
ncbi:hypothetical protein BaRGS_00027911, partial [Batillaria attramentaria]